MNKHKVKEYGTEMCPWCHRAKDFFEENDIKFEYIDVPRPMTIKKIKEKKKHNQMMIDLISSITYVEFDYVKDYTTTKKMYDKLAQIFGGEKKVLRARAESLRGSLTV